MTDRLIHLRASLRAVFNATMISTPDREARQSMARLDEVLNARIEQRDPIADLVDKLIER